MFTALIGGQWQFLNSGLIELGIDMVFVGIALQWFDRWSFICVVVAVMTL